MILSERFPALLTAEALQAVAVFPKFLADGVAVVACHYEPCLSQSIGSQWSCRGSREQSRGFDGPASSSLLVVGLIED